MHRHSVGLEEALVGERSCRASKRRVLIQADERRRSFAAWNVDGNLMGTDGWVGPYSCRMNYASGHSAHLARLSSRRQRKVGHLLHVELVGDGVWGKRWRRHQLLVA